MGISSVMATSLSGMQAQTKRLAATAGNVANAATPGYDRQTTGLSETAGGGVSATVTPSGAPTAPDGSNVDLADEMTTVIETRTAFAANAAVFETGADMWQMLMTMKRD
ncbi:MAG: flagellar basal body rod C-terminal domain-containing protein [Neorhizobium sp.]|nr:flagellar basal body rod C-terminal domain-containing protein [Neorhizobium sp.]